MTMKLPGVVMAPLSAALVLTVLHGAAADDRVSAACRQSSSGQSAERRDAPAAPPALTPAVWSVVQGPIVPVLGSDGRHHLAYAIRFLNLAGSRVTIEAVTPVDPARENIPVGSDKVQDGGGRQVTGMIRPYPVEQEAGGQRYSSQLEPGQGGLVFLDVTFERAEDIPTAIAHRVTQSQAGGTVVSAVAGRAEICRDDAVALAPPLRGGGWMVALGCCEMLSDHRTAVLPINGALRPAQTFAIDFIRLDESTGRAWAGNPGDPRSWLGYGQPVLAAAPGRVVSIRDGLPNQPIGALPSDLPIADILGNHVITDIGAGRYAFYAHMVPGSVRVQSGDVVEQGAELGLLGNSGNTSAPHLHFQVMDGPSALDANGLPFVFEQWDLSRRVAGTVNELERKVQAGEPVETSAAGTTERRRVLPLNLDIVAFP
ncbi:M23 family metallopeptidase [Belnapia sp. T18]|uniref:M23 family metallopeptidase n=1 Tax=Belnapia arida TaxID=2804533 RepID=A0ABS1U7C3_9PROT|nr:M23 family metallopeptidase [Belnapia arida]MBL6080050.1 M23 family metallopeptidase [Belnapia arida]